MRCMIIPVSTLSCSDSVVIVVSIIKQLNTLVIVQTVKTQSIKTFLKSLTK